MSIQARTPIALIGMAVVYAAFGAALWFQPRRWSGTPAYGILLNIASPQIWGTVYFVIAAIMAAAVFFRNSRALVVLAHTLAIALAASWLVAFMIRYITDAQTTVVNVASWSTYLAILVYSALTLDRVPVSEIESHLL